MSDQGMLRSLMDLQDRTERIETVDLPLPELLPPFHRFCALREYWSMARCNNNLNILGLNGNNLSKNGTPFMGHDGLVPYVYLPGASHLFHADAGVFDILGTETFTIAGSRGLTILGWFWIDTLTESGLISKWTAAGNQMAYLLTYDNAASNFRFQTSNTGAAVASSIISTAHAIVIDQWYFVAGRLEPGASTDIMVNGVWDRNAIGAPAALFNSNAQLQIGAYNGGLNELHGRVSSIPICSAQETDQVINHAFQATRGLYGV